MTKNEIHNLTAQINALIDKVKHGSLTPISDDQDLEKLRKAVQLLSSHVEKRQAEKRNNFERIDEFQDVLDAYLLRDFSKVLHISDSKDNIDAIALSINYFGQELDNSFKAIKHQQDALEKKNEEISILLKEVNHRVKNNFQIINSLISIQLRNTKSEALEPYFLNLQNRIYSMSRAHEMLYKSENISKIDYRQYILDIANNILDSFNDIQVHIDLNLNIDSDLSIDTQNCTTIGLLINEIITNSIKHAFSHQEKGEITIALKETSTTNYQLQISDNGCGMEKVDQLETQTMGLMLMDALVEQLDGTIHRDSSTNGTKYLIDFQKSEMEG